MGPLVRVVLDQFWDLGSEVRGFWEKIGHLRQAFNTIYVEENIIQLPGTRPLLISKGEVVFENVHFYYEGSPPIFEDKSLIIPGGQTVGLVGHSGGGKSTFISLILRLYDVTSGSISIDGQDISKVTQDSLYHSIAVIPQDCPLFNRSLMENIRYGRLDALDEEVFEAARKAQVHEAILSLPHGYQTLAGEKGMRLSGGQRQRIAIARAILKDAPILVLDEATSQLDALVEEKLKETFEELMQGKTVFIIAHRLSTLTRVQRILVFDAGKIVQDGSHGALLQEEGLYRKLWEAQAEGFIGGSCQTPS
jgi:ATP-binding cassette subfamily B protein